MGSFESVITCRQELKISTLIIYYRVTKLLKTRRNIYLETELKNLLKVQNLYLVTNYIYGSTQLSIKNCPIDYMFPIYNLGDYLKPDFAESLSNNHT